jgi:peptidoglycan/LPS O-acetylase OafA/YrhL
MPEPVGQTRRYMPGLDGLRALAVLAVVAYHLGLGWAPGGLLGVGVFFTLSGYLITDLLLDRWSRRGRDLPGFWLARAQPARFRDAVWAAALYVSNWQLVFQHVSYFARFEAPLPLEHLWSLAVEEQFYIVWPFVLLIGVRFVRESPSTRGLRPRLAGLTLLLAAASAGAMALLYHPSLDPSRAYYGTDTRAAELLIGAALAMVWPSRRLRAGIAAGARRSLDGLGTLGLLGIGVLIWQTDQYSSFLFRGGFVVLALCTALAVAALAHPACRLGPVLGWRPLRWVGVRSYGIYLWHFPIIVLTTPSGVHGAGALRDALQVAATLAVAALSWRFVEEPVRHGALGRLWRRARATGWRPEAIPQRGWAALSGCVALLAIAATGLAGGAISTHAGAAAPVGVSELASSPVGDAEEEAPPTHTSCRSVVHIGDSTSEGLISPEYLPPHRDRLDAQYAHVGVAHSHFEIAGARSIVENYEGEPNADEVAQAWKHRGYRGCWVLALGTNDTADVAVGSHTGRLERIEEMMSTIGNQPTMWVNVRSLLGGSPYAERNMRLWNRALREACPRYPNMRVFDWAEDAQSPWFIEDGIHYTSPGYKARSWLIARALAAAFPAGGGGTSCVVHVDPTPPSKPPARPPLRLGW